MDSVPSSHTFKIWLYKVKCYVPFLHKKRLKLKARIFEMHILTSTTGTPCGVQRNSAGVSAASTSSVVVVSLSVSSQLLQLQPSPHVRSSLTHPHLRLLKWFFLHEHSFKSSFTLFCTVKNFLVLSSQPQHSTSNQNFQLVKADNGLEKLVPRGLKPSKITVNASIMLPTKGCRDRAL